MNYTASYTRIYLIENNNQIKECYGDFFINSFIYKTSENLHENLGQLIWMLAKTDFKLRYQNSILGYAWAILKPLSLFCVLNFVFSSIFVRHNIGGEHYTLSLLVGLILFFFFDEGTRAGMQSLKSKSQLVSKIYVPRWTIIMASTIHSTLVFIANLFVVVIFFIFYNFFPSMTSVAIFILFSILLYLFILSLSLITASLFIKFRDIGLIWEVIMRIVFYASPVIYPLQILPKWIQQILLINPVAFIIHFSKESIFNEHYVELWQIAVFIGTNSLFFFFSILAYKKLIPKVAENL